jgi:hypothetical protein
MNACSRIIPESAVTRTANSAADQYQNIGLKFIDFGIKRVVKSLLLDRAGCFSLKVDKLKDLEQPCSNSVRRVLTERDS